MEHFHLCVNLSSGNDPSGTQIKDTELFLQINKV